MTRRLAGVLIATAAIVLVLALVDLARSRAPRSTLTPLVPDIESKPVEAVIAPPTPFNVTLWLPAAGGRLAALDIEIESGAEPKARVEALLRALLLATPPTPLAPLFSQPVELAATVAAPDGTLYVDLRSPEGGEPPPAGSTLELQRVYAIVHSILRNEVGFERVVLLWNGTQRRSLSGHVDTTRPLSLRPELETR